MILKLQVITSLLSFSYGIFFYYMLVLNTKFLYDNQYSLIIDLLFIGNIVLLYFILLKKINNALFHPYLFLLIILGFVLGSYIDKVIRRWYNQHRRR